MGEKITTKHTFAIGDSRKITIEADEPFSSDSIVVEQGQKYRITCDKKERWYDLGIPSSANGYYNPLALMAGMRVGKTKCFCLCGVYNHDDKTAFAIGTDHTFGIDSASATLHFFANDTKNFYWNNFGRIAIQITRLE